MAIYYVDIDNTKNAFDGLTPETAVVTEEELNLKAGDTVLFKRGTVMRRKLKVVSGTKENPITYGAYGEGEKPEFKGSMDLSDENIWEEIRENIWVCKNLEYEACNFIFDDKTFGTLRWSLEDLVDEGDFYDDAYGCAVNFKSVPAKHMTYLYSKGNPAKKYSSIECAVVYDRALADNIPNVNFENLRFKNSGMHAIAGDSVSENIKVIGCDFINIGGCVWNEERQIRFGNAVEFWNHAENIEIKKCYFDNIYDSATTHQGNKSCEQGKNIYIEDNVFLRVGMGAFELRNRIPTDSTFSGNICAYAGEGFSKNGVVMPRNSEIWPDPMGHHLFMWRVEDETEAKYEVKNNVFATAPYGAAIYSIINPECEKLIDFEGNIYYTDNDELIVRLHGKNYKTFEEYAPYELNCRYENQDIEKLVTDWQKNR